MNWNELRLKNRPRGRQRDINLQPLQRARMGCWFGKGAQCHGYLIELKGPLIYKFIENEGVNSGAAFISDDLVSKLSPAAEIGDMGRLPPPQAH